MAGHVSGTGRIAGNGGTVYSGRSVGFNRAYGGGFYDRGVVGAYGCNPIRLAAGLCQDYPFGY
jgi:hypothetical protein